MFISNTATAAMMLSIIISILKYIDNANPFQKALLLGVVVATNIGGMGTIIATPANAIAVGMLGDKAPNFVGLKPDMTEYSLADAGDKVKIISVVPSMDTPVCELQTIKFILK